MFLEKAIVNCWTSSCRDISQASISQVLELLSGKLRPKSTPFQSPLVQYRKFCQLKWRNEKYIS